MNVIDSGGTPLVEKKFGMRYNFLEREMILMKYTTLLMDADDTIFDFPKCEYNALKNTLESFGLVFSDRIHENFSEINSALWKKFEMNRITRSELRVRRFSELLKKCFEGFENAELLADKYVDMLALEAIFIDGAEQALENLGRHYEIYIITNGLKKVQYSRFEISDIYRFIKGHFISDELGVQKPQKEFFDTVLENINEKDKSRVLVVGDSLTSDMQGGRNAGLDTCLYDPKDKVSMPHELCDFKIKKLEDIMTL